MGVAEEGGRRADCCVGVRGEFLEGWGSMTVDRIVGCGFSVGGERGIERN